MPKPKSYFNLDSVNTLRQDNTGVLGFSSRGMAFHSEIQRGATNMDTIWENSAQKAFKPLPRKGLCQVPQMWTKIRNVAPL